LLDHGRAAEGVACLRRAAELLPAFGARAKLAFACNYLAEPSQAELRSEAELASALLERTSRFAPRAARGGKLRIGFISKDLRRHSVGYFMRPVLAHLDRGRFAVHCYYTADRADDMTAEFRSQAAAWLDCGDLGAG